MVAGFQDDLDSEDECPTVPVSSATAAADIDLTSDEDDPVVSSVKADVYLTSVKADVYLTSEEEEVKKEKNEDDNLSDSQGFVVTEDVDISSEDEAHRIKKKTTHSGRGQRQTPVPHSVDASISETESDRELHTTKTKHSSNGSHGDEGEKLERRVTLTPGGDVQDHDDKSDEDNPGIDVPREDFSNWLDQLEEKVILIQTND